MSHGRPMPPRPSPSPRVPLGEDVPDEPTNPHTKASNLKTRIWALVFSGGFSVVSLASVAYAYDKLETKAKDAGLEAARLEVAPVTAELKGHEARLQVLEQTSKATQADVHEARGELRDLYRAVMDGQRSRRLEAPPPALDGGVGR